MKNKNVNWELGQGYNLRAASSRWIKNGVRELELFLVERGAWGGLGFSLPASPLVEIRQAELCLWAFRAELQRRDGLVWSEAGGLFGGSK